jgi:hypothetical protein
MMRKHASLRMVAAGLVLVSAVALDNEPMFAASGKPQARAARRVKKHDSLTGLWAGAYRYRWSRGDADAVPFNARLEETGDSVTGEIDEPNTFADPSTPRLFASVRGTRHGMNVSFIKRYDGAAGQTHAVGYEGIVNPDFTRIDGQWSVSGSSGAFFMERADAGAEAAVSRAARAAA